MVQITKLTDTATIPTKAHASDAGYDLYADEDVTIAAGSRAVISTGIAMAMPWKISGDFSVYGRIAPRSGMAVDNGIDVFAGVVDSGYRGEVKVCLYNSSGSDYDITSGDRIAQMIFSVYKELEFDEVDELTTTERSNSGFGDSGQ